MIIAKHPEVLVFRNYTPLDLLPYDGQNGARILMGVNGSVYDVSQGRNFYGPGKKRKTRVVYVYYCVIKLRYCNDNDRKPLCKFCRT
jgi:hypothetical protein